MSLSFRCSDFHRCTGHAWPRASSSNHQTRHLAPFCAARIHLLGLQILEVAPILDVDSVMIRLSFSQLDTVNICKYCTFMCFHHTCCNMRRQHDDVYNYTVESTSRKSSVKLQAKHRCCILPRSCQCLCWSKERCRHQLLANPLRK